MIMEEQRQEILKYARALVENDLTKGTGGNLSVYDPESGLMLITPTQLSFLEIGPEDLVLMKLDGTVVESKWKQSSEWRMHAIQYENRSDITAVIHAHTAYATGFAIARKPIQASHYMIAVTGKDVRVAEYAPFGTEQLAKNAYEAMKDRYAVLLANHGILAGSYSVANAFNIIEECEYCARTTLYASMLGDPVILSDQEMAEMAVRFQNYGQK
ncbi:L-fuculose-phosphate aldolase [Peptoniphilaceae bacterium SGI.137]|nr:L-fuculose-phosphate aldolase [Peptoniphilaceae bacterium]